MRKFLTLGLFLALICTAAAQSRRDGFIHSHRKHPESLWQQNWRLAGRTPEITEGLVIPRPLYHTPDTVSVVFMGDMMMHRDQISNAKVGEDNFELSEYFPRIEHLIKRADIAVANMEFTLAGKPYTGYPCFSAPDSYAEAVAESGVDIFLTANNHILDKGRKGIDRTLGIYSKMESEGRVRHTGAALSAQDDSLRFPLKVVSKGMRLAFINFTYGTNFGISEEFPKVHRIDTAEIAGAIRSAKLSGADFIIALPHWGNEYVLSHSKQQGRLARWLAENGCDAIIGTHPHVPQDIETLTVTGTDGKCSRKVPVVYSLGNLISNMSAPNTQVGMMVTLRFTKDKFGDKNMLEPLLTMTWCSRPGHLTRSYTTIPIKEYVGKRGLWLNPWDYDKMITSYERVKKETGIVD
ncbi:MAG TPA: capsular biosynthesis protein [Rikenellaceae bacterium]|nr:capsular biosynthesis protein [Rikenellaceae bacterium]